MRRTAVLGVDIGGSTTRMLVAERGQIVDSVSMSSAGLTSVGVDGARDVFEALAARVGPGGAAAVCVGSAGVDDEVSRAELCAVVERSFPDTPVRVLHDAELVLAAAGEKSGVALISGTGSVAWAQDSHGRVHRAGGWGPLLGDEGGGYAIALDAVRAVLDGADRDRLPAALSSAVLGHTGIDDPRALPRLVHARRDRAYWARLAEPVLALAESGDPAARAIVETAVRALVRITERASEVSQVRGPVLLAGGLLRHAPVLAEPIVRRLSAAGLGPVRVIEQSPVQGAIRLAELMLRESGRPPGDRAVGSGKPGPGKTGPEGNDATRRRRNDDE